MAKTYKDIDTYSQKASVAGTEKIPVSSTEYITPAQIAETVETGTPVETSQPAGGMLPNVLYKLGTLSGSVTLSLAAATDNTIENEYHFTFDTGSTAPTVTWPSNLTWAGGSAPTVNASKHYEVSIEDGYAYATEF